MGSMLKKVLNSVGALLREANIYVSMGGLELSVMDLAHVSLVTVSLRANSFAGFRCNRPLTLGVNLESMTTILK